MALFNLWTQHASKSNGEKEIKCKRCKDRIEMANVGNVSREMRKMKQHANHLILFACVHLSISFLTSRDLVCGSRGGVDFLADSRAFGWH